MADPVLLMTRPRLAAERFVARLNPGVAAPAQVCFSPLIEIVALPVAVDLRSAQGVVFSSANGVAFGPEGEGRLAHCVGRQTAQAARARGWRIGVEGQTADDLLARMIAAAPAGPMVHIAGVHRRGAIAERLTASGIATIVAEVYDQRLQPLNAEAQAYLAGEAAVILPLFSPRTAGQFALCAPEHATPIIAAMSNAVAEALDARFANRVQVAQAPTTAQMVELVEKLLRENSLP